MHVHIVDHNSVHLPLIAHLVTSTLPSVTTLTFASTHDRHAAHIQNADLVVVSGGTRLVHLNEHTHNRLSRRLVNSSKPVFGICLGAEALAAYFGAKLVELPQRVSGPQPIQLSGHIAPELSDRSPVVFQYHRWSIRDLPPELVADATSAAGVELFHHKELPIWGAQFHPEVRRDDCQGYLFFVEAMRRLGLIETKS